MPHLFEPIKIRDIDFRNRIGVSPLCQYSYCNRMSNEWQIVHLGARAAGGVGFVIAEATAVEPIGRISPHEVGLWSDEHIEPLEKVTKFIHSHGAVAGVQLAHAGRKACTQRPWDGSKPLTNADPDWWQEAVGPRSKPFNEHYQTPRELTTADIKEIQQEPKDAVMRSLQAGFNLIETHADFVLLGRELLHHLTWALNAAKALNVQAPIPPQYLRAY